MNRAIASISFISYDLYSPKHYVNTNTIFGATVSKHLQNNIPHPQILVDFISKSLSAPDSSGRRWCDSCRERFPSIIESSLPHIPPPPVPPGRLMSVGPMNPPLLRWQGELQDQYRSLSAELKAAALSVYPRFWAPWRSRSSRCFPVVRFYFTATEFDTSPSAIISQSLSSPNRYPRQTWRHHVVY